MRRNLTDSPLRCLRLAAALLLITAFAAPAVHARDDDRDHDRDWDWDRDHDRERGLELRAVLTGDEEVPPVETRTRGVAHFEVDESFRSLEYSLKVSTRGEEGVGLLAVAGAHIHCAPAGENGPIVAFLAGVLAGGVDGRLKVHATLTDANIVNAACGSTISELVDSMLAGLTYVNVHSVPNPGGEVRGQIEAD